MRVLFLSRTFEVAGGEAILVRKMREALGQRQVHVDIAFEPPADLGSFDLVHAFSLEDPAARIPAFRQIAAQGVPIVLSPIYLDLAETLRAEREFARTAGDGSDPDALEAGLRALEYRTQAMEGLAARRADDPYPGFQDQQRKLLELAVHLLPSTMAELQRIAIRLGVHNKPFTVVPNGADPEVFAEASPDWFVRTYGVEDFVLVPSARVEFRKNQLVLLEALKDTDLPIVLTGRPVDALHERLLARYRDRVLHLEALSHEQMASAYKAARVMALPSWYDNLAHVTVEAALAGCSIVVGDRATEWDFLQGNAYYCDPGSRGSIREAVLLAYERHDQDAAKRQANRERARATCDWESVADRLIEAYEAALRSPFRSAVRAPAPIQVGVLSMEPPSSPHRELREAARLPEVPEPEAWRWIVSHGPGGPVIEARSLVDCDVVIIDRSFVRPETWPLLESLVASPKKLVLQLDGAPSSQCEAVLAARADRVLGLPEPGDFLPDLQGRRGTLLLHLVDWRSGTWHEVLDRYASLVGPDAEVTLALWLDPAQGVSAEEAAAGIMARLANLGLAADRSPDLLLLTDPLDAARLEQLRSCADRIVRTGDDVREAVAAQVLAEDSDMGARA